MSRCSALGVSIPDHVPQHLVWDKRFDQFAAGHDDPYDCAASLHQGPDMIWSPAAFRERPGWIATRYALINDIFLDAELFSSEGLSETSAMLEVDWLLNPLEIDPPAHRRYRQFLQPWFQPTAIKKMEPRIRQVADEIISVFQDRGNCEFIEEFASLFPSYIFLDLMGLPRDRLPQFLEWERGYMRASAIADRIEAAKAITAYLDDYMNERRNEAPRDDLINAILHGSADGHQLNHREVMGMCMNLYLGGLDTVMSSLGWHMRYLAQHPAGSGVSWQAEGGLGT